MKDGSVVLKTPYTSMSVVTDLGSLLHALSPELKNEVRELEKVSLKLCKTECRELFKSPAKLFLILMDTSLSFLSDFLA